MRLTVNNEETFVSTGGKPFDASGTVLLFIHGSGQSHLSWVLQARFFANRGWSVLAPDLPGHGLSGGEAITSVEGVADWCIDLLDTAGVETAIVIGHSQGGLVGLDLTSRHSGRVERLAIIASALAIPVTEGLLALAENDEQQAISAMVSNSHGGTGHRHDHTMPGQSHMLYGEQVMGRNRPGVLLNDLNACNNYTRGPDAAAAIDCPTLCILAGRDRMVPTRSGLAMTETIRGCQHVVIPDSGHFVQSEYSVETNTALRPFFLSTS